MYNVREFDHPNYVFAFPPFNFGFKNATKRFLFDVSWDPGRLPIAIGPFSGSGDKRIFNGVQYTWCVLILNTPL